MKDTVSNELIEVVASEKMYFFSIQIDNDQQLSWNYLDEDFKNLLDLHHVVLDKVPYLLFVAFHEGKAVLEINTSKVTLLRFLIKDTKLSNIGSSRLLAGKLVEINDDLESSLSDMSPVKMLLSQQLVGVAVFSFKEAFQHDDTDTLRLKLRQAVPQMRLTRCNDVFARQYATSKDRLADRELLAFFDGDLEAALYDIAIVIERDQHTIISHETRLDGSKMIVEGNYFTLYDKNHWVKGVLVLQKDITDKEKAFEELMGAERLSELIKRKTGQIFFDFNAVNRTIHFSGAFEDVTGYSLEKYGYINVDKVNKLVHKEDFEYLAGMFKQAIEKKENLKVKFRVWNKTGGVVFVEASGITYTDEADCTLMVGVIKNITQEINFEEEIKRSEVRYRQIFESSPLGIFQFDRHGEITDFNARFVEILGSQADKLTSFNMLESVKNEGVIKAIKEALEDKKGFYEGEYKAVTGKNTAIIRLHTHKLSGFDLYIGIVEDISEKKVALKNLEVISKVTASLTGDTFFNTLVEQLTTHYKMRYAFIGELSENQRQVHMLACSKDGKLEKPFDYELAHTPCEDVLELEICHILEKVQASYPKDQLLVDMNIEAYIGAVISGAHGESIGILVMMHDEPMPDRYNVRETLKIFADRAGAEIQRKRANQQIAESETLYRAIAENFPKGTVDVLDTSLNYIYTHGLEYNDLDIKPEDLIGKPHLNKYSKDVADRAEENLRKVLLGESVMYEISYFGNDYLKSGVPLYDADGQINRILLVTQNITESKIAEREREKLIRDLTFQNDELQKFAYITSHNLRSPVVNIVALLSMYEKDNPQAEDNQLIIEKLEKSAHLLDATLHDLVEIVSLRKEKAVKPDDVDFDELVQNVKHSIQKQVDDAQAVIETDFAAAPIIHYPYVHLDNILLNLLTNAIKYRSPERNLHVQIKTERADDFIKLTFTDNGLGIDLERYKDRIFGLYQRFHSHADGKGLGLYLVREQIRSLDGNIEIDSEVDKGTTFFVYLKDIR